MEEQTRNPKGAATARDAAARVRASRPSARELAELDGHDPEAVREDEEDDELVGVAMPDPEADRDAREVPQVYRSDVSTVDPSTIPAWVKVPADLAFPPHGVTWTAMRFLAEWTDRPQLGDRQCIVWNLSYGDEKFARRRARGDAEAMMDEQAKQMIRAIDGKRCNYGLPTDPASPDLFWEEIGKKCRLLVLNYFMKVHTLEAAERLHFFANCLVVRTVVPSSTGRPKPRARGRSTPTT